MSDCIYCGQSAGFLKSKHQVCEMNHQSGSLQIIESIKNAIMSNSDYYKLENDVKNIVSKSFIKPLELNDLYTKGFDIAVDFFLNDGIIKTDEELKIYKFRSHFNFNQEIVDKNGSLQKIVKSSILRDIIDGKTPAAKMNIQGNLPFLLQKSESLIWIFKNVDFFEQRTQTEFQGRSQGLSFRIAKGVYYRTGTFKGHPVKTEEMKYICNGLVGLTDKNIYFSSTMKNFKISYNKIVTLDPYEDGLGIQKDGASSKPQILKGLDSWFTYNLISNLNNQ
jgi:hypothetical protein